LQQQGFFEEMILEYQRCFRNTWTGQRHGLLV